MAGTESAPRPRRGLSKLRHRLISRLIGGVIDERVRWAVLEQPRFVGPPDRLVVASNVILKNALVNTNSGRVVVGQDVFFGHDVRLLTGSHDVTAFGADRRKFVSEGRDIVIEEGVWISTGATVLGPCRIGRHAVVAAGSLVICDVPEFTVVAGVPARPVRTLTPPT